MKPILKWAGGKKDHLEKLKLIITTERLKGHTYFEPFIGGGALAFDLGHAPSVINDINSELMNVYKVIRDNPDELIKILKNFASKHSAEFYYEVRDVDRCPTFNLDLSPEWRAARTIYLNKT